MASSFPSRDVLFTSPFTTTTQSFSSPRASSTMRRPSDPSFPLCTIQLLHHHIPHTLSYYSAPPHLPPNSPLFSHLLAAFSRSVEQLLSVVPVAYEGTDGLLYPPAVMLQLPDMMEGRSFKVVLPAPAAANVAVPSASVAASSGGETAEQKIQRQRRKQKKSVSFGHLAAAEQPLRTSSTPTTSYANPSSFTSTHPFNKHPLPISTAYHSTQQISPMSPSPQSPSASPLPPSLLAPSSFPLPSYTTSIPLLRSILSRAFLPSVTVAHMSALFAYYTQPSGGSSQQLPRSAFLPLVSSALRPTDASSRSAAVLTCFLSHFFTWLDDDGDDEVTEAQFLAGIALLLPTTTGADKLAMSFRLLDRLETGFVTPTSLFTAASTFTHVLLSLSHPLATSTAVSSAPAAVAFRSSFDVPSLIASSYEIAGKVVRESFGCGDVNLDQRLSLDEYHSLHLNRPSCLPWVNVLIDPEAVTSDAAAINAADTAAMLQAAEQQSASARSSVGHGRSASLPMRVDLSGMLRRHREWNLHTTGHRDARNRLHQHQGVDDDQGADEVEDEEEDDEEYEQADDNGEEDEKADAEEERDVDDEHDEDEEEHEVVNVSTAGTQTAAEESDEIDSVVQQKMMEFAMNQSGGSKRSGGRGGSGGIQARHRGPPDAEQHERDADDIEHTEAFLEAMYDELRRAGFQAQAHHSNNNNNNTTAIDNSQHTPTKADTTTSPYSLLLSATVTAPRLSSLCSSSSFQSIQPHVAPFAVLRLEQLLELFHLLTSHQDRLARADLARLTSTLSIGQSSASHATMLDTLHCLFTWSVTNHTLVARVLPPCCFTRTCSPAWHTHPLSLSCSVHIGSTRTRTTRSPRPTLCWRSVQWLAATDASKSTSASRCATRTVTGGSVWLRLSATWWT